MNYSYYLVIWFAYDVIKNMIMQTTVNLPQILAYETIDDYAKDCGPWEVWLLCSFYHESLRTWIKTVVNKFAISNHTALILGVHALRSYLKLISEYDLNSLPIIKLVPQGIIVKTTSRSDRPWSAIFYVIIYTPYLCTKFKITWT